MGEAPKNIFIPFFENSAFDYKILAFIALAILILVLCIILVNKYCLDRCAASQLEGAQGVAITMISSRGMIRINGELWQARAQKGIIAKGQAVKVLKQQGMVLVVIVVGQEE